jgi:hypothetical protein
MRRSLLLVVVILLAATSVFAGQGGVPTVTTMPKKDLLNAGSGISGDNASGAANYANGIGKVQSYLGAGGKNIDLVTYSTGRTLHFSLPAGTVLNASGLPAQFDAEVSFYGINYFGAYLSMANGSTAQVHGVLQFHYNGLTYQLDYPALAAIRQDASMWTVTGFIDYTPGFTANNSAMLSLVRKRGNLDYGVLAAPIAFNVALQ